MCLKECVCREKTREKERRENMTQAEPEREPGDGCNRRKPQRMFKKDPLLPVVKENIETGYNITENKGNGCDIAVEVRD